MALSWRLELSLADNPTVDKRGTRNTFAVHLCEKTHEAMPSANFPSDMSSSVAVWP